MGPWSGALVWTSRDWKLVVGHLSTAPGRVYCLMWVTADLISFILIVGIFVLQK